MAASTVARDSKRQQFTAQEPTSGSLKREGERVCPAAHLDHADPGANVDEEVGEEVARLLEAHKQLLAVHVGERLVPHRLHTTTGAERRLGGCKLAGAGGQESSLRAVLTPVPGSEGPTGLRGCSIVATLQEVAPLLVARDAFRRAYRIPIEYLQSNAFARGGSVSRDSRILW
jgi:hypothetical protein